MTQGTDSYKRLTRKKKKKSGKRGKINRRKVTEMSRERKLVREKK